MDAQTTVEKLSFERLYFAKSTAGSKEPCFVGKVKQYSEELGEGITHTGDLIVIANIGGRSDSGITKQGRWDVKCRKMATSKGYIVLSATLTEDEFSIDRTGWRVRFLVNGKEETLRTDDGRVIPLVYDREKWYDPEIIVKNIQQKLKFLQVPREKYFRDWRNTFLLQCQIVNREYKKKVVSENQVPNKELVQGLDRLRDKWM